MRSTDSSGLSLVTVLLKTGKKSFHTDVNVDEAAIYPTFAQACMAHKTFCKTYPLPHPLPTAHTHHHLYPHHIPCTPTSIHAHHFPNHSISPPSSIPISFTTHPSYPSIPIIIFIPTSLTNPPTVHPPLIHFPSYPAAASP